MSGTRQALILGAIPIVVGLIYIVTAELFSTDGPDPAGAVLLIALGLAMGFGMAVILRGARDL